MARGFGPVWGTSADAIATNVSAHSTARSLSVWLYFETGGTGGPRIVDKSTDYRLYFVGTNEYIWERQTWTSGGRAFSIPRGTINEWEHYLVVDPNDSPTSKIIAFRNGTQVTANQFDTPDAPYVPRTGLSVVLGNDNTTFANQWQGMLGPVAVWSTAPSTAVAQNMALSLYRGGPPNRAYRDDLTFWMELATGDVLEPVYGGDTVTSARASAFGAPLALEGPPVRRYQPWSFGSFVAPAATESSLTVVEATLGHTVVAPTETQRHILAPQVASQGNEATAPSLTERVNVGSAEMGHTAFAPPLYEPLDVQSATQGHTTGILSPPTAPVGRAGGTTSCTSDSFTPAPSSLLIAFVWARQGTIIPSTPTISDTAGLSWSEVSSLGTNFGTSPDMISRVMVARAPAVPSAMTITADCSDSSGIGLAVTQIAGASTSITNVATGTDTAGDPAATLGSAPDSDSCVLSFVAAAGSNAYSAVPTGFTQIHNFQPQTVSGRMGVAYSHTSPTAGAHQWASVNTNAQTHLIEVRPSTGSLLEVQATVALGASPEMGHTATQAALGGQLQTTSPADAETGLEVAAWELSAMPIGQWQVGTDDIPATASTTRFVLIQQNIADFGVSNATQGHTATMVDFAGALIPVSALAAHTADPVTLLQFINLQVTIAEAGHTVAAPTIQQPAADMGVLSATMGHLGEGFFTGDAVNLDQAQAQGVANAEQGAEVAAPTIFLVPNVPTPAERIFIPAAEDRTYTVATENRTFAIAA